jgi:hypothetical protein
MTIHPLWRDPAVLDEVARQIAADVAKSPRRPTKPASPGLVFIDDGYCTRWCPACGKRPRDPERTCPRCGAQTEAV